MRFSYIIDGRAFLKKAKLNSSGFLSPLVKICPSPDEFSHNSPQQLSPKLLENSINITPRRVLNSDLLTCRTSLPKDESIYILSHEVTADFPLHSHDYIEIAYVFQGTLINNIDNKEIYMSQGDLCIMNTHALHKLICSSHDTTILNFCLLTALFERTLKSLYFDENPISDFLREENGNGQNYMYFSMGHSATINTIISSIIREYTFSHFHHTYALEAYFILLFTELERSGEYSYYGIDKKALKIIEYIEQNCLQSTLNEMARELNYSANYLTRFVKKHTGRNCKDIMQEAKLRAALKMLAEGTSNIYDISEQCGYSSPSHFFQIFKSRFGVTPRAYRQTMCHYI